MEFEELNQKVIANADRYARHNGMAVDLDFCLLKLVEEVGELYQAIMIHQKKSRPEKHLPKAESLHKLSFELADVIGMALVLANRLGVDAEQALKDKWIK